MLSALRKGWVYLWMLPAVLLLVLFMLVTLVAIGPKRAQGVFDQLFW